jgi:hypothetical protein
VHTPEQALELYRSRGQAENGSSSKHTGNLGRDLLRLREQIVATGAPLLSETELDEEIAARRGDHHGEE